jgi:hypothetical protein
MGSTHIKSAYPTIAIANRFGQRRFFGGLPEAGAVRLPTDRFPDRGDLESEESVAIARPPCRVEIGHDRKIARFVLDRFVVEDAIRYVMRPT